MEFYTYTLEPVSVFPDRGGKSAGSLRLWLGDGSLVLLWAGPCRELPDWITRSGRLFRFATYELCQACKIVPPRLVTASSSDLYTWSCQNQQATSGITKAESHMLNERGQRTAMLIIYGPKRKSGFPWHAKRVGVCNRLIPKQCLNEFETLTQVGSMGDKISMNYSGEKTKYTCSDYCFLSKLSSCKPCIEM
jgi:hypothetical protein